MSITRSRKVADTNVAKLDAVCCPGRVHFPNVDLTNYLQPAASHNARDKSTNESPSFAHRMAGSLFRFACAILPFPAIPSSPAKVVEEMDEVDHSSSNSIAVEKVADADTDAETKTDSIEIIVAGTLATTEASAKAPSITNEQNRDVTKEAASPDPRPSTSLHIHRSPSL
jgi:hypothetical protein